MTTSTAEDFYSGIEGAMTPEQAVQALALAEQGDTGLKPESGSAPAPAPAPAADDAAGAAKPSAGAAPAAPAEGADKGAAASPAPDQITADNAVVLAKDGKHTIPYATLEKHRQGEQHWRAAAEAAQQQLASLQAQAQARADAGQAPTKTDNMAAAAAAAIEKGADASLFGDFSEAALAEGIQKLVAQTVQAQVAQAMQPMQAKHQQDALSEHERVIYGAHPNADSIVQSEQFKAWVDAHPTTVRNALWQTFDPAKGGTAAEVVEVLDAYSKAHPQSPAATTTPPATDPKAAAQAAVKAAPVDVPNSLTSIPGGRVDAATPNERMADLSGPEMLRALEGKTPAQIEAFLNQQL